MKGNNPTAWQKLLALLDERMQFNLLERVRKVQSYHVESEILYLETLTESDAEHLIKSKQSLTLFAADTCHVKEVRIRVAPKE